MRFHTFCMVAAAGAVALAGCHHRPPVDMPVLPDNIQRGDTLVLGSPMTWPAGTSEIILQNERTVARGAVVRELPYCAIAPIGTAPRSVAPGPMTVRDVFYDERGSGGPGGANSTTRVEMVSGTGAAYAMTCGWPDGAPYRGFVSVQQIFNAVGGQFSLGVPK